MSRRLLALATVCLAVGACASRLGGYRHPELRSMTPRIRTVAVAPFVYDAPLEPGRIDSAGAARVAESVRRSAFLFLQQRHQEGKLTTVLQSMEETDGHLAAGGVEPAASTRRTPAELAALLGVDAVLRGRITDYDDPSTGSEAARTAASLALGVFGGLVASGGGKLATTYSLHDARTGELLWEFEQTLSAGAFRGPDAMLAGSGKQMAGKYPLKR